MVRLTVVLVRDGMTKAEVRLASGEVPMEQLRAELADDTANDDLKWYHENQQADERGDGPVDEDSGIQKPTLSQLVDPELTDDGYWQAQEALAKVVAAMAGGEDGAAAAEEMTEEERERKQKRKRKLAFFTAPNRSCAATAAMMTCADVSRYGDSLVWRLTTLEGASAPASIPVVVSNGLCNGDPHVKRMAGYKAVVSGGLMHCAAAPFNDGRNKCPLMKGTYYWSARSTCLIK